MTVVDSLASSASVRLPDAANAKDTDCSRAHADAPHGFNRNASHSEDRYVCDCEDWTPAANGGWQPIETAPKDGTLILGYDARCLDGGKHAANYVSGAGRIVDESGEQYRVAPYEVIVWLEDVRPEWYCVDSQTMKRRTTDRSRWARSQGAWYPSHWMPLPPPPVERE